MALIDEISFKPAPDFEGRMKKVLLRAGEPDRVPFYELFADKPVKDKILGKPTLLPILLPIGDPKELVRNEIEFWHRLGYDYVPACPAFGFGIRAEFAPDTAQLSMGARMWINETGAGLIKNREDYEKYPWPDPDQVSFELFDEFAKHLPKGMVVFGQVSGVLENTIWLLGYENLAYLSVDDPELLKMIFDQVGSRLVRLVERMCEREFVGAIQMGDDMGFKTQTILSPKMLKEYVFPWHKKAIEITHRAGKPFILHSCGNLEQVMEDIIANGIDAKHSFEDGVTPVVRAKKLWGDRIAILGGVDVDFLARATPSEVREYTEKIIRECAPGGGYALGTGNSVTNYIPPENYLTMLQVGWELGKYPF